MEQALVHPRARQFDHFFDARGRDGGAPPKTGDLFLALDITGITDHVSGVFEPGVE